MNQSYTLGQLALYFLRLGTVGFGGPVALVGYMHRDLVETRRWISEDDYRQGLALAQLAPGPLAAQLAIYLGYVHHRIWGATVVGLAFVLPSFAMVVALGYAYVRLGGLPWMQAVFYGVGAAVIGIIAVSTYNLTRKSLGKDPALWGVFGVMALTTAWTESENVWLLLGAGVLVWALRFPPKFSTAAVWLTPLLAQAVVVRESDVLVKIAVFFTKAGAFVFGSGLAIVPFLYAGVVKEYQWLSEQQFLDAVAVAMITPGPVVITVGFIGYLVAGFPGACVAAAATFLPCYLLTVLPAPYFKKWGQRPQLKAFVEGITAAAVGTIAGAVVVLGRRQLVDAPSVLMALAAAFVLYRFKKIGEPYLIFAVAALGLLIKFSFSF